MNLDDKVNCNKKNKFLVFKLVFLVLLFLLQGLFMTNKYYWIKKNNGISFERSNNSISFDVNEFILTDKIPVFTFHRIVPDEIKQKKFPKNEWAQSVSDFEKEISYLYDHNYKTLSLDELYCWYVKKCDYSLKTVVLTLDDGNWDDYYLVLPILKKYNYKATTFVVGSRTYDKNDSEYNPNVRKFITKELMKKTSEEYPNLNFQSHSYNFHDVDKNGKQKVLKMNREEIFEDFKKNEKFKFSYIAYPYGIYTKDVIDAAKVYNYKLGFSFGKPGYVTRNTPQYEMPRIKLNGQSSVETLKKWLYN